MDEQDAIEHAPNSPNWGNLEHYHEVGFDNLEEGKYYYYKFNYHQHYIVLITHKFNDRLKYEAVYWRLTSLLNPDLEYDNQWGPVGYQHSFNISLADLNDQAPAGPRKFFIYDEDVVMAQNGGGLVEDINERLDESSYILPAGTVARRIAPVSYRTTPPFFMRKTLRRGRKVRKSRKANKKRSTRRRR